MFSTSRIHVDNVSGGTRGGKPLCSNSRETGRRKGDNFQKDSQCKYSVVVSNCKRTSGDTVERF